MKFSWSYHVLGYFPPVKFSKNEKPKLIVVVDTEEEFDWNAPADRSQTGVTAMDSIYLAQDIFDEYGIVPCYVIDYPIVSQESGYRVLKKIHQDGRCEIGAHLHPWVTPPFVENMELKNTFPGNLSAELEEQKLRILKDQITNVFEIEPTIYKAGRYGVGSNTASILERLGFEIDLSIFPPVDFSFQCGPNFTDCHAEPFWFGLHNQILEIPATGAFVGWGGGLKKELYGLAINCKKLMLPGVFSRLSIVDRLVLSPEGFSTADHIKLTQYLYKQGVRTFTWSFHSTSIVPGYTPYVQSEDQLKEFLKTFHSYFDYFFNELGGESTTPTRLRKYLLGLR